MVSRRVLQRVLDKVLLGLVLKVEVIGFAVFLLQVSSLDIPKPLNPSG